MKDPLRKLALRDGLYAPEAFTFLYESLEHAVRLAGRDAAEGSARHVSGQELLNGMREYARELFGPFAGEVWRRWGVKESIDWGRIVFLLVEENLLNRQDSDSIQDFAQGFDFDEWFVKGYEPKLPPEILARDDGNGA
ncbi:MAG: hypothetical protein HZA53_06105 [Planctomycetes bacterium]|nr:hypothetical protein [Planctomycetota bacterium]